MRQKSATHKEVLLTKFKRINYLFQWWLYSTSEGIDWYCLRLYYAPSLQMHAVQFHAGSKKMRWSRIAGDHLVLSANIVYTIKAMNIQTRTFLVVLIIMYQLKFINLSN